MLTKSQTREIAATLNRMPILGADYAARALSALHRAAMRQSQKALILAIAQTHGLTNSPDFII